MFFNKKSKKAEMNCNICESGIKSNFRFCPFCGVSLVDLEEEAKDFGILGKLDENRINQPGNSFSISDKLIGSIMNGLIKNIDAQMRDMDKMSQGGMPLPGNIKIKIAGIPQQTIRQQKPQRKSHITEDQLRRMEGLPRTAAKTHVRRLSDRVVYELVAPGIKSEEDVIISKLESGYELKAIGEKKAYVNSLPLSLPIRKISLVKNKLLVEFKLNQE